VMTALIKHLASCRVSCICSSLGTAGRRWPGTSAFLHKPSAAPILSRRHRLVAIQPVKTERHLAPIRRTSTQNARVRNTCRAFSNLCCVDPFNPPVKSHDPFDIVRRCQEVRNLQQYRPSLHTQTLLSRHRQVKCDRILSIFSLLKGAQRLDARVGSKEERLILPRPVHRRWHFHHICFDLGECMILHSPW
jgi:hypothetical protein